MVRPCNISLICIIWLWINHIKGARAGKLWFVTSLIEQTKLGNLQLNKHLQIIYMKAVYKGIIEVERSEIYHSEKAEKWEAGVAMFFYR